MVKIKRFDMQPMFEEDAIAQMEELGHAFFVFLDAETEQVAVLYRRRDGSVRAHPAGDRLGERESPLTAEPPVRRWPAGSAAPPTTTISDTKKTARPMDSRSRSSAG